MKDDNAKHRMRVRARVKEHGLDVLQDYEVIEYLLFFCIPVKDTKSQAKELIRRFGSVSGVLDASYKDLIACPGIGEVSASFIKMLPQFYKYYDTSKFRGKKQILCGPDAGAFAKAHLKNRQYETFGICCMDIYQRILGSEIISTGSIDEVPVYNRLVVEAALKHNSYCCFVFHNHPGGTLQPSIADRDLTDSLKAALQAVDIKLYDHIIVAGDRYLSFSAEGFIDDVTINYDAGMPILPQPAAKRGGRTKTPKAAADKSIAKKSAASEDDNSN